MKTNNFEAQAPANADQQSLKTALTPEEVAAAKERFLTEWKADIAKGIHFVREYVIRIEGDANGLGIGWSDAAMEARHLNNLHAVGFIADEVERYYQTRLENRMVTITPVPISEPTPKDNRILVAIYHTRDGGKHEVKHFVYLYRSLGHVARNCWQIGQERGYQRGQVSFRIEHNQQ